MPTKIRLQRYGKKGMPYYHLVIADGRAPRDGKFIEKIGIYNPLTKPATIDLDFDRALYWVGVGADPSDTARAILSYKGVLYKNHLLRGVAKGSLTAEMAEQKFQKWLGDKESRITESVKMNEQLSRDLAKKRKQDEVKVKEEREKALAAKSVVTEPTVEATEEVAEVVAQDVITEEAVAEVQAEEIQVPETKEVENQEPEAEKEPEA